MTVRTDESSGGRGAKRKRAKKKPARKPKPAGPGRVQLETRKIAELVPAPYNPREISEKALAGLEASVREFGLVQPVIVNKRTGFVVGGHQRIKALEAQGVAETDVVVVDIDEDRERALNMALNSGAISGAWTPDAMPMLDEIRIALPELSASLMLPELSADLAKLFPQDAPVLDDVEPGEPPDDPVTQPGDLWTLGRHRLECGDATTADLPPASCVFTSPPYAVGIDYGETYEDTIQSLRTMLPPLASSWFDSVEPGGFAVVNFGDVISGASIAGVEGPCQYPMALEYFPVFIDAGWSLWSERIWAKPHARVAAPWCASSNRAASDWEHIWTWKKPGPARVGRVKSPPSYLGVCDTSRLAGVDVGKDAHGAGMPVGIAGWMIENHSLRGDVVIEPFAGTGTTLVAAEQLDRTCHAIEISPAYCDVVVNRWEQLTGKKADRAVNV